MHRAIHRAGINRRIKWKNWWDKILRYWWVGPLSCPCSTDTEGTSTHACARAHTRTVRGCLGNSAPCLQTYPVGWNFELLTLFHQSQHDLFLIFIEIKEALCHHLTRAVFFFIHVHIIAVSIWWHFSGICWNRLHKITAKLDFYQWLFYDLCNALSYFDYYFCPLNSLLRPFSSGKKTVVTAGLQYFLTYISELWSKEIGGPLFRSRVHIQSLCHLFSSCARFRHHEWITTLFPVALETGLSILLIPVCMAVTTN